MNRDVRTIIELLTHLLGFYATIGLMAIGFGVMCAGEKGARAMARFFFARPLQWIAHHTKVATGAAVAMIWTSVVRVIGRAVAAELKELQTDFRWLVSRERGWLARFRGR